MRHSYPFMRLARQLGVPYAQVLLCADFYAQPVRMQTAHTLRAYSSLRPHQRTAVLQALHAEREHQRAALAAMNPVERAMLLERCELVTDWLRDGCRGAPPPPVLAAGGEQQGGAATGRFAGGCYEEMERGST
jgi:hypothetical protein